MKDPLEAKLMRNPAEYWTTEDWEKFTEFLKGLLKNSVATVTFTKVDGSERVMQCTLDPNLLPKVEVKEDKKPRKQNEDALAVYDVEAKGWRSFRIKSVKHVTAKI